MNRSVERCAYCGSWRQRLRMTLLLPAMCAVTVTAVLAQRPAPPKSWTVDTTKGVPVAVRRGGVLSTESTAELLGPVARDATPLNDWLRDFARRNAATLGAVTEPSKDTVGYTTVAGNRVVVAAYAVAAAEGNRYITYSVLQDAPANTPVIVARSTFRDALTMMRAMRSSIESVIPYVLAPLASMQTVQTVALVPRAATSFKAAPAEPTAPAPAASAPTDTALVTAIGAGIDDAIAMLGPGAAASPRPSPSSGASTGTSPAAPRAPATTASAGASAGRISSVVFYQFGDLQYHPVVLFADGTSFDISDVPAERVDVAASKASEPASWGRWRNTGRTYYFRSRPDAAESDYQLGAGGLFTVFPASASSRLNGDYKSVSGSAMGEMSTLLTSRFQFMPNGRFTSGTDFAASGSGEVTGVTMAAGASKATSGRYEITRFRIVLTYDSGEKSEYFFGFGSGGYPARPDEDMIFIGRTAYVR